ncbi:MAG: (2Fe-2S) ferredoxin domain-containing protein [Thermomicrobiales bacterium]
MYWTKKHVFVCTASHCMAKGANDVVGRLRLDIVRKKLDTEILINNCSTIDLCDIGPNIVVYPDNIIYKGVTVKDLPDIVEHLKGGPVVERLLVSATTPDEVARKSYYLELLNLEQPLSKDAIDTAAERHSFDQGWVAEQMRRGFVARKVDQESGAESYQVTKKARGRYSI